jgi:5-methylcytosine-specific restriction protein B
MANFDWVPFYEEYANKLLEYKDDRQALVPKLRKVYEKVGYNFPKMKLSDDVPDEIDPITAFGLFNKSNMTSAPKRIDALQELGKEFSFQTPPPTGFDGVPLLYPLSAIIFDWRKENRSEDSESFWNVLAAAVAYADNQTDEEARSAFIRAYDAIKDRSGLKWRLSMGLFWFRPYCYLSLDSRNRKFLADSPIVSKECADYFAALKNVPTGEEYLNLCAFVKEMMKANDNFQLKHFPELSHEAFIGPLPQPTSSSAAPRYWLYAPGANAERWDHFYKNGTMGIGWHEIGDLRQYSSQNEIRDALKEKLYPTKNPTQAANMLWRFANDIRPGDVVFVKKGVTKLLGRGEIVEDVYSFDDAEDDLKNVRKVEWTDYGEWDLPKLPKGCAQKTLTDITDYLDLVETLNEKLDKDGDGTAETGRGPQPDGYGAEDFLNDVYMSADDYERLVAALEMKKNVVLQGAPGTGKTYAAKRLAFSMMGVQDESRVAMVQFHQSYSYEDFIMGYRPTETGFELRRGVFYEFCKEAETDPENKYFFIIDEINRGNMSKIFGELFMLIECDKRGVPLQLLYANEKFSVPENVYIIGMMNTADRSLAMLDFALRRRFAFFDMKPGFDSEGFVEYQHDLASEEFDALVREIKRLNEAIAADEALGEGFCVGHSFLCGLETESVDAMLQNVVDLELIPLLKEYWYDEPTNVETWAHRLRAALQ